MQQQVVLLKRHRSSEGDNPSVSGLPVPSPRASPPPDRLAFVSKQIGTDVSALYKTRLKMAEEADVKKIDLAKLRSLSQARLALVDFICTASEEFRLKKTTAHIAVAYLDRILSIARVHPGEMSLLAVACLRLAAKFEEAFHEVPSAQILLDFHAQRSGGNDFVPHDVNDMELLVFRCLDFRLFIITPVHFLEMFSALGLFYSPLHGDRCASQPKTKCAVDLKTDGNTATQKDPLRTMLIRQSSSEMDRTTFKDVAQYCEFFVDLSQQHVGTFQLANSALLGVTVLACARRAVGVSPIWSGHLQKLTSFDFSSELRELYDELWNIYDANYRQGGSSQEVEEEDENANSNHSLPSSSIRNATTCLTPATAMMSLAEFSPLGPADLALGSKSSTTTSCINVRKQFSHGPAPQPSL